MEFLRFGSSIPGVYWGCCAVDIIQNFKVDPDAKASSQIVSGDSGTAMIKDNECLFAGPTYKDIFLTRLRVGTFHTGDMPNHTFFAVLEHSQIANKESIGHKWLAILREAGFEFIRTVDNSVYTGAKLQSASNKCSSHKNYIFGLFRNIGNGAVTDPFEPPKAWTDLPEQTKTQTELWKENSPTKLLKESEIVAAGAPVTMSGLRSQYPPQVKAVRDKLLAENAPANAAKKAPSWLTLA